MIFLTIRTDKPEAEIGLFDGKRQLAYEIWPAHRELSVTIHKKISELLAANGQSLQNLDGIIGFAGPGSFTGLRIGLTVANALAYGMQKPVVATQGDNWISEGIVRLQDGKGDKVAIPEYGAPANITRQKK